MAEEKNAPWLKNYGTVKFHLEYPDASMADAVFAVADESKKRTALSCKGKKIDYKTFKEKVVLTAKAFTAMGIKPKDIVTICMPNLFQTVYAIYALNYIGAVASMIHPLSAEEEIAYYLKEVGSSVIMTLDTFYNKIVEVEKITPIKTVLLTGAADELGFVKKSAYKLVNGKKRCNFTPAANVIEWKNFIKSGKEISSLKPYHLDKDELAVILFSGGTTGTTKGIKLSSYNFNAQALQTANMCAKDIPGKKMLAAMPCFHGFGLGVCIHTALIMGAESMLVPRFNVREYAKLIKKYKPNYIAGVPTLYEALTRDDYFDKVDLSCLMGVFSGGDKLTVDLKRRFDKFLADHGATVKIREGYGMTECVSASCLTPYNKEKEGSIGFPFPDTYFTVCSPATTNELKLGEVGELCIKGPSVMLGYFNRPDEDAITLLKHDDGDIWLHTGDLGYIDEEGYVYFVQRLKRMIVTSGYNVYPSQIESVLDSHEAINCSCVIGVKDAYKMQKVKAFVELKDGREPTEALKNGILAYCKKRVAKYAMPKELEFRKELPRTLVGKVAYSVLEKEEAEKSDVK